ncbi:hypothetical protein [Paenibacillus harenae]|uniref:hypothetical protein n=1 Tax=Paenibacillus harenae TaxID=306543 RepID=UPI0003FDEEB5|nr:hypothetical protein [Paenibacillus harenae]
MNKALKRAAFGAAILAFGIGIGTLTSNTSNANTALTPGSVEDPVVTKSYVDEQLAKLGAGGNTGGGSSDGGSGTVSEASLEVVAIPAGKTLMAGQGTEVIVRVGKAIAYSSDANGIADLTAGSELTKGKAVPTNHLLLFPREGRGILPDPAQKNGLTVLIRGSYTIQ